MSHRVQHYRHLLAVPPLVFLALFYFYPLAKIFDISFWPDGIFQLEKLKQFITTGYYLKTLWFTFWQAAVSTLLTLLLALPGAYVFARYRFRGKRLFRSLVTVPFVLPTVVVAAAFQALLGPNGLLNEWLMAWLNTPDPVIRIHHTVWFILLAHIFYNYTIVFRLVGGFWANMEQKTREAALMLGASPRQAFFKITLPMLYPVILAAALLVFIFCFSSFGVILILGGPRFATIEVEIYRQAVHLFNLPMAAALSLVQILFTFGLMGVYARIQRKAVVSINPVSSVSIRHSPSTLKAKLFVGVNLVLMMIFLGSPLLALLFQSFSTESGISTAYYTALFEDPSQSIFFVPPIQAVLYSLGFAGLSLLGALCIGLFAAIYLARQKKGLASILDPIFMLPLSTSAVTLGFGFILALDQPPLNLRASLLIVPIAHTLVAFPFVVRSILPALRSIPNCLREAAAMLGASSWKTWRAVELPIIGRVLLVGAVFAFTISLGEYGRCPLFQARQ